MEQEHQFIDYIEQSIIKNWDKDSLTDYKGITLQYKDVARKIAKFHIVLESAGIQPGDKIAVCGRNSAHWAVTFLATITYGAVIVPILHEFKRRLTSGNALQLILGVGQLNPGFLIQDQVFAAVLGNTVHKIGIKIFEPAVEIFPALLADLMIGILEDQIRG